VCGRQDAEGWANSWAREVGKVGAGRGFGRGDGPIIKAENPDRARNAIVVIGLPDSCCAHAQCFHGCNAVHCRNRGANKTGSGKVH